LIFSLVVRQLWIPVIFIPCRYQSIILLCFETDNISTWDGEAFPLATRFVPGFGNGSVNTAEVFELLKNFLTQLYVDNLSSNDPHRIYDMDNLVSYFQEGLQKIFQEMTPPVSSSSLFLFLLAPWLLGFFAFVCRHGIYFRGKKFFICILTRNLTGLFRCSLCRFRVCRANHHAIAGMRVIV
jgi:hypothetical protein